METNTLNQLADLCKKEFEYRDTLLEKYTDLLTRSEGRVDNINHMIADLITMHKDCGKRVDELTASLTTEQANTSQLIDICNRKDERIHVLEEQIQRERERYDALLERYIVNNSKCNENNFHLK